MNITVPKYYCIIQFKQQFFLELYRTIFGDTGCYTSKFQKLGFGTSGSRIQRKFKNFFLGTSTGQMKNLEKTQSYRYIIY